MSKFLERPTILLKSINREACPPSLHRSKYYHQKWLQIYQIWHDTTEFYPSISEGLLNKSINFAESMTSTDDNIIQVVKHTRESLLFDNRCMDKARWHTFIWCNNGSFDAAEWCEFLGLYILRDISVLNDLNNVGIFRNDGVA